MVFQVILVRSEFDETQNQEGNLSQNVMIMAKKYKCWKRTSTGFTEQYENKCFRGDEMDRPMVDVRPQSAKGKEHCVDIFSAKGRELKKCGISKPKAMKIANDYMKKHDK